MTIRTIGELVEELQKWPASGLVDVCLDHHGQIGMGTPVAITSVSGYAGGAIDGSDSGVSVNIATCPDWNGFPLALEETLGKALLAWLEGRRADIESNWEDLGDLRPLLALLDEDDW